MSDNPHDLVDRIRAAEDRKHRAEVAGLSREPVKDEDGKDRACETCIYYLPRFGWCDQPDLDIAVDSDWWCKLWRI